MRAAPGPVYTRGLRRQQQGPSDHHHGHGTPVPKNDARGGTILPTGNRQKVNGKAEQQQQKKKKKNPQTSHEPEPRTRTIGLPSPIHVLQGTCRREMRRQVNRINQAGQFSEYFSCFSLHADTLSLSQGSCDQAVPVFRRDPFQTLTDGLRNSV